MKYLPKVFQEFNHHKQWRTKTEAWMNEKDIRDRDNSKEEREAAAQDVQFQINNMKAEIMHMNRLYSPEKLQRIEESMQTVVGFGFEIESLSATVHGCIQKEEIEVIHKYINQCATKLQFKELKSEMAEFVEKQDFQVLKHENDEVRKDLEKVMKRDEVLTRFNLLN